MAAEQWSGGGGGLWAPPSAAMESLFPDEPAPAAAVLGIFGAGGLQAQLHSLPPLCAAALFGYPQDNFDMFHAQDLAQLAAQVAQKAELEETQSGELNPKITPQLAYTKYSILDQAHNSSFSSATSAQTSQHVSSSVIVPSMRCIPTLPSHTECIKTESNRVSQVLQGASITLDRPADDGYNWRKYGQKAVKGGRYPRSYYKCTLNCPVRKNVEHSEDGKIIKIIYRGQHSHERPSKRYKDCGILLKESDDFNDTEDASTKSQLDCLGYDGKPVTSIGTMADYSLPMREGGDEKVSGTSDYRGEGDDETRTADEAVGDTDANERNAPGQKIIVSTTSDVDLLDDGYRWRKYGQKVVRGNPHPRSYYKCTYQGCDVKKHIERSSQEPHAVITTYEGKHVHDVPGSRNRSHAAGQPYCTEQTYSEQSSASFCSRSEKGKYSAVSLKHVAF